MLDTVKFEENNSILLRNLNFAFMISNRSLGCCYVVFNFLAKFEPRSYTLVVPSLMGQTKETGTRTFTTLVPNPPLRKNLVRHPASFNQHHTDTLNVSRVLHANILE